jgi:hypothetical protein
MTPLVLSYSALATFSRCRRAYYYGYELNLEPRKTTAAIEEGSDFHRQMQEEADFLRGRDISPPDETSMTMVAEEFLYHHPLPGGEDILSVEEPIYVKLLEGYIEEVSDGRREICHPDVWLRCTPDLVYKRGKWTIVRDYKTFEKKPVLDRELDLQCATYQAVYREKYGPDTMFEYVHVRRTPPGVSHNKKGDVWEPEECYIFQEMYAPDHQLKELWREQQNLARDLVRAQVEGRFYRQPANCCGGICGGSLYKELCTADIKEGGLTEEDKLALATKKEPTTLPKELQW